MRIHHILGVFVLISVISCQSPQPEEKEVLFDSTKNLTDQTVEPGTDASPDTLINNNKPEGPDSNFIKKKNDAGIDFFATGTEPFWSLDLDFEKQFSFKTMDDFTLNTPSTEPIKSKNPNIIRYRAVVESGEIIISIQKKECINQMSGFNSPYEVIIRAKSSGEKDFTEYKGCGRYTNKSGIADKTAQPK